MDDIQLKELLRELICQKENECLEFKYNFHEEKEIGEDISALANSAGYYDRGYAYLVFGIKDGTNEVLGTSFHAKSHKIKNEELTFWLIKHLKPKIEFEPYEFDYEGKHISLYKIPAYKNVPIRFNHVSYIRIGSNTTILREHSDIARKIWTKWAIPNETIISKETIPFEKEISKSNLSSEDVISLLSIETYCNLMKLSLSNTDAIIKTFEDESFIIKTGSTYSITNLGAILLARNINSFNGLRRKVVRVIT